MDDNEFEVVEQMIRKNRNRRLEEDKEAEEAMQRAIRSSIVKEKIEHKTKKIEQLKTRILAAIATIIMTCSLAKVVGPIIIDKIDDMRTGIEIVNANSDEINEIIRKYGALMGNDGERSIETITGRNFEKNEPYVDYTANNINNLAMTINEAAQISEIETRCVIIAAYRIINEPYRERILDIAFDLAVKLMKENPDQDYKCSYLYERGIKGFLEGLGYEDIKDYNDNERDNIKNLSLLNKFGRGGEKSNGRKRI